MRTNQKAPSIHTCCAGGTAARCGERAVQRFPATKDYHPSGWHYRCDRHWSEREDGQNAPFPDEFAEAETTLTLPDVVRRVRRLLSP